MSDTIRLKIKIDPTKIPKGHTAHRSGSGKHKNWRRENRQDAKLRLKRGD